MIFIILFALQRQALRACRKAVNLNKPTFTASKAAQKSLQREDEPSCIISDVPLSSSEPRPVTSVGVNEGETAALLCCSCSFFL